jgi:hypothetical protein
MALLAICGSETTAAGYRLFNISEAFSSVSRRIESGVVQTDKAASTTTPATGTAQICKARPA